MQIKQLKISHFRCYEHIDLSFDKRINVFYGANGSGKTTVLEAIYFISTGKSFRSKRNKNLIQHDQSGLAVFAHFLDQSHNQNNLGITLSKSLKKKVKLNQQSINNQSDVAHVLPVVSIDPDSYLFLDKPPQFRRSYFDWLVFHVKPEYLVIWSKVNRCHKQLNTLYKEKKLQDLIYWESQYIHYASQLNELREQIFDELKTAVCQKVALFLPELGDFEPTYRQGWSQERSLSEQIKIDRDKNLLFGNLLSGCHKMDIKSNINKKPAHENLSRGQKKIISSIYYISYIELLSAHLSINPILCLDDMDAELDPSKTAIFSDFIQNSNNQIFITTVDKEKLSTDTKDTAVFHVEHQQVSLI
ncbi:DNA replication and repair protein RecF [Marinicella sp. S1101]|uniref:DNA replication/repair protein RecF n=1 Tax=Marinicella marina TaxID=2996016 RepID=UPI002260BC99|nr:DNA replication and repair protein RecF [Marinicella marina]MCX7553170.1 DNA replication and repair protein RecF [Marinicella marina]MDJ1138902.1 DNA replication and repair protein RecF [Marinicella marina]